MTADDNIILKSIFFVFNQIKLVRESPVGISPEESGPHLRQHHLGHHGKPGLQGIINLDLALLGVHLNPAGATKRR